MVGLGRLLLAIQLMQPWVDDWSRLIGSLWAAEGADVGAVVLPQHNASLWDFATSESCAVPGFSNSSLCQLLLAFSTLQCFEAEVWP